MKYRPEIDGLRAFAVIPVILFHAGIGGLTGGFIGVDIFFVISGFLISSILLQDIEQKRFSIISFYERRARRILPALIFTLLLIATISWIFLPPQSMRSVFQQLVSNAFFASNFHYTLTWGYFEQWTLPPVFLNTWSLAVEEQFYLIIPFLIYFLRNKIGLKVIIFCTLTILSLLWMVFAADRYSVANYYLLPSRFWELSTGTLLAFIMIYQKQRVEEWRTKLPEGMGFLLAGILLILCFYYTEKTPYPSMWTIPVIVATLALIMLVDQSTKLGKILSSPLLVYIGKLSYPLYLLHFPLIVLSKEMLVPLISELWSSILAIIVTTVLSIAVYHIIESKFRSRQLCNSARSMLTGSAVALALIAVIGGLGHQNIIQSRSVLVNAELSHLLEKTPLPTGISISDCAARNAVTECLLKTAQGRPDNRVIMIIGDSFAANLIIPLWEQTKHRRNLTLKARVTYACSFMPSGYSEWDGECGRARKYMDSITKEQATDIVFHINFTGHLLNENVGNIEDELKSLTSTFDSLNSRGIKIHVAAHRDVYNFEPVRAFVYPWLSSELNTKIVPSELDKFYTLWRSMGVDVYTAEKKLNPANAHKYYRDSGHLSYLGSKKFLSNIGLAQSPLFSSQ